MLLGACADCSKPINRHSTRCYSCAAKERMSRPGAREKVAASVSKSSKIMWQNPEFRAKMDALAATPEHRAKMSRDNRKTWTPEAKAKFSAAMKRLWDDPNSVYNTPEYRGKLSAHGKQQWADGLCDGLFDSTSAYEWHVAELLDNLGIVYTQQYRPDGYYRLYDFYLPCYNVLMEVDGEFWHHSAWAHENDVPYRDMEKERWALEHGYGFVRLDEPTVLHDNLQSALEECFQKGGPKCY